MIKQVNLLDIVTGMEAEFEQAFGIAEKLLARADGYEGHSLSRCVESPSRYLLLINWRALEDHTVTFRTAPDHLEWKRLLDPFYAVRPQSTHFASLGEQ